MRTVIPLDFSNKDHRGLLFDLAVSNQRHLLNDHDNDIVLIIGYYEGQQSIGRCHPFVAVVDGQPAGCFWVEVDSYDLGRIRGALFPKFRDAWNGSYFLRWVTAYAFDALGLRKIDCELALYNKKDKESAAAERIMKRIGFKKRAILPEALMINGEPKDTILLDFLKRDYDVKKETK